MPYGDRPIERSEGGRTSPPNGRKMSPVAANILSIDVEDWYQLAGERLTGAGKSRLDRLECQLDRLLALLGGHGCRATFFCLGKSLEHAPHLVRRIADAGHEVASHGWEHQLISSIGLQAFRADLERSLSWLRDLTGRAVAGYRAPAFSVTASQLESFYDICFEAGLLYDSSVFPFGGRRYGISNAPVAPTVVRESNGRRLVELPLTTVDWGGRRWPVAGGGYWRVLPRWAIDRAISRVNREGRPVITYFHPYEFDCRDLSVTEAAGGSLRSRRHGLAQNLGRKGIYRKLDYVLSRHAFSAAEDYLREGGHV